MSSRNKRNRRKSVAKRSEKTTAQHNLPDNSESQRSVSIQRLRVGPLPDPDTLREYEQVYPGIAERIVQRFEKEAEHRHAIEHKIVDAEILHQKSSMAAFRYGQFFAFTIAIVGLTVSGVGVYHATSTGHAWAAASIGGVSLATLVGVFIYGRTVAAPDEDTPRNNQK